MKRMPTHMFFILLIALVMKLSAADNSEEVWSEGKTVEAADNSIPVDEEKVEYARGSVCGYCAYCKFCKLCDQDCPCERSQKRPNCHMCKYCKYCNLCSAICDTVCTPGGILDRVTGAIVNSLPSFSKDEVDGDIASVQTWIDKKKDEL